MRFMCVRSCMLDGIDFRPTYAHRIGCSTRLSTHSRTPLPGLVHRPRLSVVGIGVGVQSNQGNRSAADSCLPRSIQGCIHTHTHSLSNVGPGGEVAAGEGAGGGGQGGGGGCLVLLCGLVWGWSREWVPWATPTRSLDPSHPVLSIHSSICVRLQVRHGRLVQDLEAHGKTLIQVAYLC